MNGLELNEQIVFRVRIDQINWWHSVYEFISFLWVTANVSHNKLNRLKVFEYNNFMELLIKGWMRHMCCVHCPQHESMNKHMLIASPHSVYYNTSRAYNPIVIAPKWLLSIGCWTNAYNETINQ